MEYQDFEIQLGADGNNVTVQASRCEAGTSKIEILEVPPSVHKAAEIQKTLRWDNDLDAREEAKRLGHDLFNALLCGEVRRCYDRSLEIADSKNQGLRILLRIPPREPRLAQMAALPWEWMNRLGDTNEDLCLNRKRFLVRYPEVFFKSPHDPLPARLKILCVVANPRHKNLISFNAGEVKEELWRVNQAAGIEIEILPKATKKAVCEALSKGQFHVLHFTGHGGFDDKRSKGFLSFETENGEREDVIGEDLTTLLKANGDSVRLVVLNSCWTARASGSGSFNPFGGVANSLILGGIAGVVAMQFPLSVRGAITFSRAFYSTIVAGERVDEAVFEGRLALFNSNTYSMEWATPVLYLQSQDGRVFAPPEVRRVHLATYLNNAPIPKLHEKDNPEVLLWSLLFKGNELQSRTIEDKDYWNNKILPDLIRLRKSVPRKLPVAVTSDVGLSISLAFGYVFRQTTGIPIYYYQINGANKDQIELWRSDADPAKVEIICEDPRSLAERPESGSESRDEVLVSFSITRPCLGCVQKYLMANPSLSSCRWLDFKPAQGSSGVSIKDNEEAIGYAKAIVDQLKQSLGRITPKKVHLFLATPAGLAIFLGRLLNAIGEIQVYEYQQGVYVTSFLLGDGS